MPQIMVEPGKESTAVLDELRRRMRHARISSALVVAAFTVGCRTGRVAPRPMPILLRLTISSEDSEYSPVLRAAARVQTEGDSLLVKVDSGFVLAPGQPAPILPPVMADLALTAIVAVPRPPDSPETGAPGAPLGGSRWMILGTSSTQYRIDSLRVGVPYPLSDVRFALRRPAPVQLLHAFLVLRVTGTAVEIGRPDPDGVVRPGRSLRNSVRVYACGAQSLDGHTDSVRATALAHAYTAAC